MSKFRTITIDAIGLGSPYSGTAIYVSEIIKFWNLKKDLEIIFIIFANNFAISYLNKLNLDDRFVFIRVPSNRYLKSIWQQTFMVWHLHRIKPKVHWGASFILPLVKVCPMIVTIHDMTFQLMPKVHEYIKTKYFPFLIKYSTVRANKILTVSKTTKSDLIKFFPNVKDKTFVTHLAPRDIYPNRNIEQRKINFKTKKYLLYVGAIEPRKNLVKLIKVWKSINKIEKNNVKLLLVGTKGWKYDELLENINDVNDIHYFGSANDQELLSFYKNALGLIYISLYEGFGLPVIEAMKFGLPVICSNLGASKEIAESAAIMVNPLNEKDIKDAIIELISNENLRKKFSRLGIKKASNFSWSKTADETFKFLTKI